MSFDDLVNRSNAAVSSRFGRPGVIKSPGHADNPVTVIFDQNSLNEMGVLTDKPQASINMTDLAAADVKASTITINSVVYKMSRPMPDGSGMATVLLTRN